MTAIPLVAGALETVSAELTKRLGILEIRGIRNPPDHNSAEISQNTQMSQGDVNRHSNLSE